MLLIRNASKFKRKNSKVERLKSLLKRIDRSETKLGIESSSLKGLRHRLGKKSVKKLNYSVKSTKRKSYEPKTRISVKSQLKVWTRSIERSKWNKHVSFRARRSLCRFSSKESKVEWQVSRWLIDRSHRIFSERQISQLRSSVYFRDSWAQTLIKLNRRQNYYKHKTGQQKKWRALCGQRRRTHTSFVKAWHKEKFKLFLLKTKGKLMQLLILIALRNRHKYQHPELSLQVREIYWKLHRKRMLLLTFG